MKGSAVRLLCVAMLVVAVIASPVDKPKKNLKKYLYKKQGPVGEPFLPMPLKTKSNSYPATLSKLPRGEKSFPSVVYISDSPDDEAPPQQQQAGAGGATSGITDFFDRISRTFGRTGNRESELVNVFPGDQQDDEAQYDSPSQQGHHLGGQGQGGQKPTAFPSAPVRDHLMNDEEGQRDDEDSGSEEDEENEEEEDEEEEDVNDDLENSEGPQSGGRQKLKQKEKNKQKEQQQEQEAQAGSQLIGLDSNEEQPVSVQSSKNKKNKNKPDKNAQKEEQEENQEESDEEEEENDEEEMDIPDNVPPYIRQSMIEEHKRRKQQDQQGGGGQQGQGGQGQGGRPGGYGQQQGGPGGYGQQQGGPGGPGRPEQGGYGGYGQGGPPQQPSGAGGFLSSLLG